jgi:hypothetical protein
MNMCCKWTCRKRSMNVNDSLNLYYRTAERGCAEKETTMVVEGTLKKGR